MYLNRRRRVPCGYCKAKGKVISIHTGKKVFCPHCGGMKYF